MSHYLQKYVCCKKLRKSFNRKEQYTEPIVTNNAEKAKSETGTKQSAFILLGKITGVDAVVR